MLSHRLRLENRFHGALRASIFRRNRVVFSAKGWFSLISGFSPKRWRDNESVWIFFLSVVSLGAFSY
jgi:hypothetical protein